MENTLDGAPMSAEAEPTDQSPTDHNAESKAAIIAAIKAEYAVLVRIEVRYKKLEKERAERSARIGDWLYQLHEQHFPRSTGKWTKYLKSQLKDEEPLPFVFKTAYNYMDIAWLRKNSDLDFAIIAKMPAEGPGSTRDLVKKLKGGKDPRPKRQSVEEVSSIEIARLMKEGLPQETLLAIANLIPDHDHQTLIEAVQTTANSFWRLRLLPEEKRGLGLARLMADSGAFSAFNLGKTIDLGEYCSWLEQHGDMFEAYVALDVIAIHEEEFEDAAHNSFENYQYMRERGLAPIPVYHNGEKIDWLKKMLDAGCQYVGLSTTSLGAGNHYQFYERCHEVLRAYSGVKTHAFGEARQKVLTLWPFTSADSTTWLGGQKFGHTHEIGQTTLEYEQIHAKDKLGLAARTYQGAYQFMRIERQIQYKQRIQHNNPHFTLYLAFANNNWCFPAFRTAHCYNGLVSFFYVKETPPLLERTRAFIKHPEALLARPLYADIYKSMLEARRSYGR